MLVALSALAVGCGDARDAGPLAELGRLHDTRSVGPRVSIESTHHECSGVGLEPPAGEAPALKAHFCNETADPPKGDLLTLASRVSAMIAAEPDPEALHAAGLIDLLWGGGTANSLDRAISHLAAASRLAEEPAAALADLAAAHLMRFELSRSSRDLVAALEAADRATELAPNSATAAYNLAYAADRLTLDELAGEVWAGYTSAFPRQGWANEARARAEALAALVAAPIAPEPGAAPDEAREFARRAPREARILGWDELLGRWGAAYLAGDTAAAIANLDLAAVLGAEIARGGDATLADAVAAIELASADPPALRALAASHKAYADGREALTDEHVARAAELFASGLSLDPASPPLRGWLSAYHGFAIFLEGEREGALSQLLELAARVDEARHPALAGQLYAALTTIRLRAGNFEDALHTVAVAAGHYERSGEREAVGSQLYLQADVEMAVGSVERSYATMFRSLETLRPDRLSVWRYNALMVLGEAVAAEGLHRAAIRLLTEGVSAMERAERNVNFVEGLLVRARVRSDAQDDAGARQDLARAREGLAAVDSRTGRIWLATDLRLATAAMMASDDPLAAKTSLDSILADPTATGTEMRLVQALVARADARLALGEREGALADLERASDIIATESASTGSAPLRLALLDRTRSVFDRLALAEADAGDAAGALEHLERGRLSFTKRSVSTFDDLRARLPQTERVLSYLLVGDTILAWVASPDGVSLARTIVPRQELARTLERTRASLELGAGELTVNADLDALYQWLIRPVARHLGAEVESIAIVADGEIAAVPFAALGEAAGPRLVERYRIRFVPSVREAVMGGEEARARDQPAVFVAVSGTAGAMREFAALPESTREVRTLAGYYPGAVLLADEVNLSAVRRALGQAGLFHFAGHAVFDETRPELSYLVLPEESGSDHGRLTAAAIEGMDLSGLRLVVLSACETLGSRTGRSGGFGGFAGILLTAGARGVIGSTWMVDDAATAHLMIEFHRAYSRSGDGPGALRTAQLQLLRSENAEDRSPAAWAAFRYAGR